MSDLCQSSGCTNPATYWYVGGAFCTEHGADPDIEEQLAAARERIKELEASLISIREFAEGHHQQQQGHFWLHALQVDIPEMVDVALE